MELIFKNDYFDLLQENSIVYIEVKKVGYDINKFNDEVLASLRRVKITKIVALSAAIKNAMDSKVEIGKYSPIITVSVSDDKLEAYGEVIVSKETLDKVDQGLLISVIKNQMAEMGIVYGIIDDEEILIDADKKFLIAKGVEPVDGKDAIIKPYELLDIKPKLETQGGVDHYELNVINKVSKGDWLGERIEPTDGRDGMDVFGNSMAAHYGKQIPLKYDDKSVREIMNDQGTVTELRAIRDGAVIYVGESVMVQNYIEVDGTVGFGTGNIDFNGYVDVKGSIEDNFSVVADENIQILGTMGVGACQLIESKNGDVYIRGGIAGKHKAIIKAKGNVYIKFANDCTIICDNQVNIGYYAMNCVIQAKEVIFESTSSQLIGGETEVHTKVVVSELGSHSGSKTHVKVIGFDKELMKEEYNSIYMAIELIKSKIEEYSRKYEKSKVGDKQFDLEIDRIFDKILEYKAKLEQLYKNQKYAMSYLQTKGSGEVRVNKELHSHVLIDLLGKRIEIKDSYHGGKSIFYENEEIKEEII